MMHRFTGESTFDNASTVACLGEETPSLLSDDELGVGPLTIVKSEVTDVLGTKQELEVSIVSGQPAKFPELTEMVTSMPQPALKYGCPKCPKTFDNKIDRMLHEQIHTFKAIPRISDISGYRCIDLNASERRVRRNIYGKGDEGNQTDIQENNTAEDSESGQGSFNMHNATFDNTEDFGDKRHSVWDAGSESESSICDDRSDEECSENVCLNMNTSNESTESSSNVENAEDASNTESQNASVKHQRKTSINPNEDETSGPTVIKKKSCKKRGRALTRSSRFTCSYCDRVCKHSQHLRGHLMIHTGEQPYKCDVCGKGFIIKAHFLCHKMTHRGERPYKCTDCDKTFVCKSAYVQHCKIHTGERQHCCQYCGKKFSQARNLKYHVSRHKGPKPYRCLMCKKNYSSSDKWKRHVEKKHNNEYEDVAAGRTEKKKPCKRPHECKTCGKFFQSSSHLKSHRRIHTGERPFSCEFCDRQFTRVDSLNRHLLTHSGRKPYVCIICKVPFSAKEEMVSHRQMTHAKDESREETAKATLDSLSKEPSTTEMADSAIAHMNDDIRPPESPEEVGGAQPSSASKGFDVGQKSVERKKKRRHSPSEIENEVDVSISHALTKISRKRDSMLSTYMLTETQEEQQSFLNDVDEPPSVPQEGDIPFSMNESIAEHLTVDRHGQRIRFKRSYIECIIEKNVKKHPNAFYLVWSKKFTADLATVVALNGPNCILCVKNFDPSSLPDVWSISPNFSIQTATVNFGSVSQPVHFFNFGDMNLPLSRRSFKSYKKIESSLKKFVQLEGMELKNILKYSKMENSWYNALIQQLNEDCIVTNKV